MNEIRILCVSPEHRRSGIGRALIMTPAGEAASAGIWHITEPEGLDGFLPISERLRSAFVGFRINLSPIEPTRTAPIGE